MYTNRPGDRGRVYDFHWTGSHAVDRASYRRHRPRGFFRPRTKRVRVSDVPGQHGARRRDAAVAGPWRVRHAICADARRLSHQGAIRRAVECWRHDEFVSAADAWVDVREQWKRPVPRPAVPGPHAYCASVTDSIRSVLFSLCGLRRTHLSSCCGGRWFYRRRGVDNIILRYYNILRACTYSDIT